MRAGLVLLWLLSLTAVVLLSIWPFNFDAGLATPAAWAALWDSWGWRSSRGDIAGNLALFVPVGFLGMLAMPARRRALGLIAVAAVSFAVAVGAQMAQVYLPGRSATMVDVVWNLAGLAAGMVVTLLPWQAAARRAGLGAELKVLPWLIIGCWLAYRLAPFIPSLDLQLIKDNLKPLLLHPELEWTGVARNAVAWLAVAFLLRDSNRAQPLDALLPLLIGGVFLGETIIAFRDGLSAANVAGGGLALAAWFGLVRWLPGAAMVVWLVLAGRIVLDGLWPFVFHEVPLNGFRWLPFSGVLGGSMGLNVLVLLEKAFLYAALAYCGWVVLRSWLAAAAAGSALLFAVEWLQRYQTGHVPEITDVVMLALASLAGAVLAERTLGPASRVPAVRWSRAV